MSAPEPNAKQPTAAAPPARETDASPAFDALGEARRLLREGRAAALATLAADGAPFASLVNLALKPDGAPILLMSRLAAHTRHLERDGRLSLLISQTGEGDPLAHPRLTLVGRAARADEPEARAALRRRFLARHPKSALYADFTDFSFWSVEVLSAHLNGGFARAANFSGAALLASLEGAQALIDAEQGAVEHMNADHAEALALYAQAFAGRSGEGWTASGIDPDGLDLTRGDEAARIVFPRRVVNPAELRALLVEMAEKARARRSS